MLNWGIQKTWRKPVFPIRISREGGHFEDGEGVPFLWQGDTAWRLFWMLSDEQARSYIDARAAQGFSVLQIHLLPHHIWQTNYYGENPFEECGVISKPNERYFSRADRILRYAESKGLAVALAPMWLSTWEDDWYQYYHGEEVLQYSFYVAERYKNFPNIIAFIHGGDDDALPLRETICACAELCKRHAPHILNTFHAGIRESYTMFGDEDWYDFCLNYTYDYDSCIRQMIGAKTQYPGKPAILGETHYEGNAGIHSGMIRKFAYTSMILGGTGQTFGNKDIWMGTMFFEDALCSAGAQHMLILREFMETVPWYSLRADREGTEIETVRSVMPGASAHYIPTAISEDHSLLLAYVDDRRYFVLSRKSVYTGEWADPVSGRRFVFDGGAGRVLSIPGCNAEGTTDWILLVRFEPEHPDEENSFSGRDACAVARPVYSNTGEEGEQ